MPVLHVDSPGSLALGIVLLVCTAIIALIRKPGLPRGPLLLAGAGILLLALAAGEPIWWRPEVRDVAVMVDLSPSTRTADYRQRPVLEKRIRQLLGGTPYHLYFFADDPRPDGVAFAGPQLSDLPAERTVYNPPPAAAILLFSDAQFALPAAAPPTYVVIDPALDHVADATVERLEIRPTPRGPELAATIRNSGPPRSVNFEGIAASALASPATAPAGDTVLTRPLASDADIASARLSPGDAWPENDVQAIRPSPPFHAERWWVGINPPGGNWKPISPAALPNDAAEYLGPAVIVLNNVAAGDLSTEQQKRLMQYVRDLGGALIFLGGDHAFAAGGYPGTALETISPLASTPPRPAMRWLLLADSSGSMADPADPAAADSPSKWQMAARALVSLLPLLPPSDIVSVGDFAADVRWWSNGQSAAEAAAQPLPPAGLSPRGPTNLEAALKTLADQIPATGDANSALPVQLLIISDVEATIDRPGEIIAAFKAKNITLHVLAIGSGEGPPGLRAILNATGGSMLRQGDAARWTAAARQVAEQSLPNRISTQPVAVSFDPHELAPAPPGRSISPWNGAWLKPNATQVASAIAPTGQTVPMAARWQLGSGEVIAAAFAATAPEAEAFSQSIARPPRDPGLRITWETGPQMKVRIDAATPAGTFLNGLPLTLELTDSDAAALSSARAHPIPQIAPGRYELTIPAPRIPVIATLYRGTPTTAGSTAVIDRQALPGRYAPEFDAIGNNHETMRALATQTAGSVIDPHDTQPIEMNWPPRRASLQSLLAAAGALFLAAGLLWWRLR